MILKKLKAGICSPAFAPALIHVLEWFYMNSPAA